MKKFSMVLLSLLLILIFAGCSADKETATDEKNDNQTEEKTTAKDTKKEETVEPTEPTSEDLCHFCNMKIYTKDEEMGVFTAQAVKEDGTHVFFDDAGCLLNAQRKFDESYTNEWVRDYNTTEWIEKDQAIVVKANVMTPMKYGYLFFKDEASANKYIAENQTNGVISNWEAIDTEAVKRYEMKMKKEAEAKAAAGATQESGNMEMNMNQ